MIWFNKVKYQVSHFLARFSGRLKFRRIDFSGVLIRFIYLGVFFVLGVNIYTAFNKGVDTINKFQIEEQKLADLIAENKTLEKQENQYNSLEYKRIYARENLNLAGKNETLYYVDRKKEQPQIEQLPEDVVHITLANNIDWWKKLILGI